MRDAETTPLGVAMDAFRKAAGWQPVEAELAVTGQDLAVEQDGFGDVGQRLGNAVAGQRDGRQVRHGDTDAGLPRLEVQHGEVGAFAGKAPFGRDGHPARNRIAAMTAPPVATIQRTVRVSLAAMAAITSAIRASSRSGVT